MIQYDENYYMRGKELGISGYTSYSWLPDMTVPMAGAIVTHCRMMDTDRILDFGCARGYLVKALRMLGYDTYGVDVSQWATENCDEEVREYVSVADDEDDLPKVDWIIAKDVLEHIPYVSYTVSRLMACAEKGVFIVVPLSPHEASPYVVPDYEGDATHCQRRTLSGWIDMFIRPGWSVEASYRVPGIKDNYASWEKGNGFLTARRIK